MANLGDFHESDLRSPENLKTVFMDTNLGTHLGISVSDTVTVSDLIEKIKVEHPKCFPAMGEIRVHAIKVKRKGNLYHLSDSMLIKSAFGEGAKNWFLSVDASGLNQQGRTQHFSGEHGNQLALPWVTNSPSDGEPSKGLSIIHQSSTPPVTNMHDDVEEEMASKKINCGVQNECSFEAALDHVPASKKQRKSRRKESDVKSLDEGTNLISDTSNVKHKAETLEPEFAAKDILRGVETTSSGLVAEPLDIDESRTRQSKTEKRDREGVEHSTVARDQQVIAISSPLGDAGVIKSKSKKKKKRDREGEVVALSSYLGDAAKEHFFNENVNSSKNYPDNISGASALGNDIHQEALTATILSPQKGEHDGHVHDVVDGNEVPSSQMRTFVADHDAGNVVGDTSVPQIAPECCRNGSEGFSKDMDNGNNDVVPSSHQSLSSDNQKYEGNSEGEGKLPPNLDYEVKLHEIGGGKMKKKAKKSSARNKDESSVKHTIAVVAPSTGPDSAFDDHLVNERKNDNSILSTGEMNKTDVIPANASGEGDNVILNDARTSLPSDADTGRNKRKEKKRRTSASRNGDQLVAKSADNASNLEKNQDESSVKHTYMSDIPSTGCDPAFDGHLVKDGRNDDSILSLVEKTKSDVSPYASKEGDNVILNDAEVSLPSKADTGRHKRKKKNRGTFETKCEDGLVAKPEASDEAKKKDESSVKHTNMSDLPSSGPDPAFDGRLVNERNNDDSILSRDGRSKTDVIPSIVSGEGDNVILSDADISLPSKAGTGRRKRKRKNHASSASRNEDQLVAKPGVSDEAKKKNESSIKHTNMSDLPSSGPDPAFDGRLVNERNNDDSILSRDKRNKTDVIPSIVSGEDDNVILSGADVSLPSKAGTGRRKRNRKNHASSASRNEDQLVAKSADNASIEAKEKDDSSVKNTNMSDIPSTECDPAFDSHLVNERRDADSILSHDEKNKTDGFPAYACKEGDSVILNDADISLPSEADTGRHKRKKKNRRTSAKENEDELVAKPADDASNEAKKDKSSVEHTNMNDFPSTGLVDKGKNDDSIFSHDERNKTDVFSAHASREGDSAILNDANISLPSEADTGRRKRKEKNRQKSASRNEDDLVAKSTDNASNEAKEKGSISGLAERNEIIEERSISFNASHVTCGGEVNNMRKNESKFSQQTEMNGNQFNAEDVEEKSTKDEESSGDERKEKRVDKSSTGNEDEVVKQSKDYCNSPVSPDDGHLINASEKDKSSLSNTEKEINNVNEPKISESSKGSRGRENMDDKLRKGKDSNRSRNPNSLLPVPTEEQTRTDNLKLNQMDRTEENAGLEEGLTRKTKKKRKASLNIPPDLPMKDHEVDANECIAKKVALKEVQEARDVDSVSIRKKTEAGKTSDPNQSTGSELEAEKSNGLPIPKDIVLSEFPSAEIPNNIAKPGTESKVDTDNHANVTVHDNADIDFMSYFAPPDEQKDAKRLDKEIERKEKHKMQLAPFIGTSHDLGKSSKLKDAQKSGIKIEGSIQSQDTKLKAENNDVNCSSKKKPSKVSGDGANGIGIPDNDDPKVSRSGRSAPANKGNSKLSVASSSGSKNSGRPSRMHENQSSVVRSGVVASKPSIRTKQDIDISRPVMSLLTTPGAIFGDGSNESSADDNGTLNSDSSTHTPSNTLSPSESEGEIDSRPDSSLRAGSYAAELKETGGRTAAISHSRQLKKNMRLEDLLRSSSRFKEAILNFSSQELMEDTESQPVDFVPDSEPNP